MSNEDSGFTLDPQVLDCLVCPVTHSPLTQQGNELIATIGGLRYPIRDGIPVLIAEQAKLPPGYDDLDIFIARHGKP